MSYDTRRCVVVLGTGSLQRYIFQSNRLKENLGASFLAKHCFDHGLIDAIKAVGAPLDTEAWKSYESPECRPQSALEMPENKGIHLIYVGGGNAALLCENRTVANKVVKKWSRKLSDEAPGLRVTVGYGEVKCSLAKAYKDALDDLARCEEALPFGSPLHSLPVVRRCTSTGFPASEQRTERNRVEWISQAAARKRDQVVVYKGKPAPAQEEITKKFCSVLKPNPDLDLPRQRFAIELDDLGGYEGQSHIAVVHADGNGMGRMRNEVINQAISEEQEDSDFLHCLRIFSASVTDFSQGALEKTLQYLKAALPLESLQNPEYILPLRPIVYGGDDLTFVCDGRLGLDLAAYYLQAFKGSIQVGDKCEDVDACAGVAIVPTKFPFAQVYSFAEELCGLAKSRRREKGSSGSWLDFQIIQEGATGSVTAIRKAQYLSLEGQTLHQRPYMVQPYQENEEKKWDDFVTIVKGFQSAGWPRTRSKRLLRAIAQGPKATNQFLEAAGRSGIKLPVIQNMEAGEQTTGWINDRTRFFDPLEAIDFYLEAKRKSAPATGDGAIQNGDDQ